MISAILRMLGIGKKATKKKVGKNAKKLAKKSKSCQKSKKGGKR